MTDIILSGCSGKMGASIIACAAGGTDCKIAAGVDIIEPQGVDFAFAKSFEELDVKADAIVDFSNPAVLDSLLTYAKEKKLPCVICTTGYNEEQKAKIQEAAKEIPVFYSGNMSLGINLIIELAKKAAAVFGDNFDVEIVEQHHNQKLDAPSGTALMIADAVSEVKTDAEYVYDRHAYRKKRDKKEIGIHSVRGGNIVGEHEIIFAGTDEILKISHSARSKSVFAVGALNAAAFLKGKEPGMYDMSDLLASK
ncbi:MAG: 4-hydroxy-tetrahydrodipicolinate reductase [Clostridia bacterium]|nr:4-hydroxy-tetrahydrodipicolinate reductase [Clostridia bacterium]